MSSPHVRIGNTNTVNILDFGAKGDGVTDDSAAIQAALDWATYANFRTARVIVPATDNSYLCNTTLRIRRYAVILEGENHNASQLTFPAGVGGVVIDISTNTTTTGNNAGQYGTIRNLTLSGTRAAAWQANHTYANGAIVRPSNAKSTGLAFQLTAGGGGASGGTEPTWSTQYTFTTVADGALTWTPLYCSGIISYTACRIHDVFVNNFDSDGVSIIGDPSGFPLVTPFSWRPAETNSDLSRLYDIVVAGCGGNGYHVLGGAANACTFSGCSALTCQLYGIHDESDLGNLWDGCHTDANGVNVSAGTGGCARFNNTNAPSTLTNFYSEGGQHGLRSDGAAPPTIVSGEGASGLDAAGSNMPLLLATTFEPYFSVKNKYTVTPNPPLTQPLLIYVGERATGQVIEWDENSGSGDRWKLIRDDGGPANYGRYTFTYNSTDVFGLDGTSGLFPGRVYALQGLQLTNSGTNPVAISSLPSFLTDGGWRFRGDRFYDNTAALDGISEQTCVIAGHAYPARQNNTFYSVGQYIALWQSSTNYYYFKCTTQGTTANSQPAYNLGFGATTTDGTAVFTVYSQAQWQANTVYATGAIVLDTVTGFLFQATVGGTSGASRPAFPGSFLGNTGTDNTITWRWIGSGLQAAYFTPTRKAVNAASTAGGVLVAAGTGSTTIATLTPHSDSNYAVYCYYTVANSSTDVTVTLTYNDGGSQSTNLVSVVGQATGSYRVAPVYITAKSNTTITVAATASNASNVKVSANIVGH